jgi:hypothetical protein
MLPYLKEQPYDERLKHLKLPTLIPFLMLWWTLHTLAFGISRFLYCCYVSL